MFELPHLKELSKRLFHEKFDGIMQEAGFHRMETGFCFLDLDKGYVLSVEYAPTPLGDTFDIGIGLSTVSDGGLYFNMEREDALCHQGQYEMMAIFYYLAIREKRISQMEGHQYFLINLYYEHFVDKVFPILSRIHDEESCYEAMFDMDKIFTTKAASNFIFTAIRYGRIDLAKRRMRRAIKSKRDWMWRRSDEFEEVLILLEEGRIDELNSIIDEKCSIAREKYMICAQKVFNDQ